MNEPKKRCRLHAEQRVADKQGEHDVERRGHEESDLLKRPLVSVQDQKNPKRYQTEDRLRRYRVGDAAVRAGPTKRSELPIHSQMSKRVSNCMP